ncbi:MAG: Mannose-1-phosphate guanylyltransferase RfbM [Wolbachia endosymbiont of Ctenocephalides orientis wCori]|nr:MAG: Mannose-1-phosphate guanylyltransferase RfbM [Wolbachia endosymbiont of Ctenocephalides orientis wCori]
MHPVILCGGSGSRLWPLSQPKQFQKIFSNNTMLQNTLLRLKSDYMSPIIATNIEYKSLIMEELKLLQDYKVIFEPVKLGTAATILIAALLCNEDEIMIILPSDHFIGNLDNFHASIEKASQIARETDAIVTFGTKPNEFNSEYGYMLAFYDQNKKHYTVKDFIEKPVHDLGDNYYWNSGIFVFKAKCYIDEVIKSASHLYNLCHASTKDFLLDEKFLYLKRKDFEGIEGLSTDYLVMEKAENIAMIKVDFDWIDIGTWNAILELSWRLNKKPITEPHKLSDTTNAVANKIWLHLSIGLSK